MRYIRPSLQSNPLCRVAIEQNCDAFQYVKNKTHDLCLLALKYDGKLLKYIEEIDQTYEFCIEAIKQNPDALKYVLSQTQELCDFAIKLDCCTITLIKNPDFE